MVERSENGDPLRIKLAENARTLLTRNRYDKIPIDAIVTSLGEDAENLTEAQAKKILSLDFAGAFKIRGDHLELVASYSLKDLDEEIEIVRKRYEK